MFGIDYYDAILLSGEYQADDIRELEQIRNLPPKELKIVGIPYMDEMAARLEKAEPLAKEGVTVLLAPSWGKSAIFGVYGGKIIEKLKETGYHIVIRPHPQSWTSDKELLDELMKEFPESEQIEWNRDVDNFEILRKADILISDFSGVTFDFSLIHNKPIIYTNPNYDLSPYDAWWLKNPPWTISALPKMGRELTAENMENIKELIDSCLNDSIYQEGREWAKSQTWAHCGKGAENTAEYLISKYEELTEKGN